MPSRPELLAAIPLLSTIDQQERCAVAALMRELSFDQGQLAAIQAPVIMMSQNRQDAKDRIRSELDYQVNLKAELEIADLHRKIDALAQTRPSGGSGAALPG